MNFGVEITEAETSPGVWESASAIGKVSKPSGQSKLKFDSSFVITTIDQKPRSASAPPYCHNIDQSRPPSATGVLKASDSGVETENSPLIFSQELPSLMHETKRHAGMGSYPWVYEQ